MTRYICLLRGINVSGQKKIKMSDLRSLFEKLGFLNVQTYIQSGNVIFDYEEMNPSYLEGIIKKKIHDNYGFDVPTLVLIPSEVQHALDNNPFKEKEKVYFTFLVEKPIPIKVENLRSENYAPEEWELVDKVFYFYSPDGYGKAKMNNNFVEKRLSVSATTRNFKTTHKLLEMANFAS